MKLSNHFFLRYNYNLTGMELEMIKSRLEEFNGATTHTECIINCPVAISENNQLMINDILLSSLDDERYDVRSRVLTINPKPKQIMFETFKLNKSSGNKINSWKKFWIPEESGLIERIIIELINFALDENIIEPITFSVLSTCKNEKYFFHIYILPNSQFDLTVDVDGFLCNV